MSVQVCNSACGKEVFAAEESRSRWGSGEEEKGMWREIGADWWQMRMYIFSRISGGSSRNGKGFILVVVMA